MLILAQVVRVIAAIFCMIADGSSEKKKIFFYNGVYNFLDAISYFMLGAFAGGIGSLAAIGRNVIFYKSKNKVNIFVLISYLLFVLCLTLIGMPNWFAIIPFFLVATYTTGLYIGKVRVIKWCVIITCVVEIVYDYIYLSYAGIVVCVIDIIIVAISMVKDRKKEEKNEK